MSSDSVPAWKAHLDELQATDGGETRVRVLKEKPGRYRIVARDLSEAGYVEREVELAREHGLTRQQAYTHLESEGWRAIYEKLGWRANDKHQYRDDAEAELRRVVRSDPRFASANTPWQIRVRCERASANDDGRDGPVHGGGPSAPEPEPEPSPDDWEPVGAPDMATPKPTKRRRPRRK